MVNGPAVPNGPPTGYDAADVCPSGRCGLGEARLVVRRLRCRHARRRRLSSLFELGRIPGEKAQTAGILGCAPFFLSRCRLTTSFEWLGAESNRRHAHFQACEVSLRNVRPAILSGVTL